MSTDVFLPHVAQASGSGFNAADARRLHTRLHGIQGLVMDEASRSQFATDSRESLRRHLLILTARNRLLNLTHGRAGNVRVIDELPDDLHPPLLSETEVRFSAVPDPTREHLIEFVYLRNELDTGLDRAGYAKTPRRRSGSGRSGWRPITICRTRERKGRPECPCPGR